MTSIHQLAIESNGAIQVDEATDHQPVKIFLAVPIKQWWDEGRWDTQERIDCFEWRDAVRGAFVKAGFLVYSPHRAWQGAWHPDAQIVNNAAIAISDYLVDATPDWLTHGDGTLEEIRYARKQRTTVVSLGGGGTERIATIVAWMHERKAFRER